MKLQPFWISCMIGLGVFTSTCEGSFSMAYTQTIPEVYALSDQKELIIQQDFEEKTSECIVSWNAIRPSRGYLSLSARVRSSDEWSNWIKIGAWGRGIQRSFSEDLDPFVKLDIDVLSAKNPDIHFDSIEVKITAEEGASLYCLRAISVCAANEYQFDKSSSFNLSSVLLDDLQGQSQMILPHPRCNDMCSPTSTTVALNYLLKEKKASIEVLDFAAQARDDQYDIYGNWVLNAAAAFDLSNGEILCRVERLNSFTHLHQELQKGLPVVVSIKGPIKGSAKPYAHGHLIVVIGWDADTQEVICMDPAFPTSEETRVRYSLSQFLEAWGRRKNLSYTFQPRT